MRYRGRDHLTGAGIDPMVQSWGQQGFIKRIQRGITQFDGSVANKDVTISEVDMANSIAFSGGYQTTFTATDNPSVVMCAIRISSPTNLQLIRGNYTGMTDFGSWTVIEFQPGVIRSLQRVASSVFGGAVTIVDSTISAVDLNKTFSVHTYAPSDGAAGCGPIATTGRLTSATNYRFERGVADASYGSYAYGTIVEFW